MVSLNQLWLTHRITHKIQFSRDSPLICENRQTSSNFVLPLWALSASVTLQFNYFAKAKAEIKCYYKIIELQGYRSAWVRKKIDKIKKTQFGDLHFWMGITSGRSRTDSWKQIQCSDYENSRLQIIFLNAAALVELTRSNLSTESDIFHFWKWTFVRSYQK